MADISALEKRINELENRIKQLEKQVWSPEDKQEQELMEQMYTKAQVLAQQNKTITAAFLQRKLWIDLPRAKKIMSRLVAEGIVQA